MTSNVDKDVAHPPRDRLSLEALLREEARLVAKLGGKEDGIGIDVRDEEEQEFDDGQQ